MKTIKLSMVLLLLMISNMILAQNKPELVIIRWSASDKSRINNGDAYFFIINENSEVESIKIQKERLEEGKSAVVVHKKLTEYYAKGYKLISSNFSGTADGYCEKGEYILQKE